MCLNRLKFIALFYFAFWLYQYSLNTVSCLKILHCFFELIASIFIVFKQIEAGASWT